MQLSWLIVPKLEAGGSDSAGVAYTVAAHISYAVGGTSRTFDTAPESFTVQPLPRLRLDYTIPYVVMGDIPFSLKVAVTNVGHSPANSVTIASAQPRIIDNINNLPISFGMDGSAATANGSDFRAGNTTIEFGPVAAQAAKAGYWQMHTTRRGFFIDFASTLSHRTVNGQMLDPLIEQVQLHFQAALGGRLTASCDAGPLVVRLDGGNNVVLRNSAGDYYISEIPVGRHVVEAMHGSQVLATASVDVLGDQPTDFVDLFADTSAVDSDSDSMPNCYELSRGLNPSDPSDASLDLDIDGLTNVARVPNRYRATQC